MKIINIIPTLSVESDGVGKFVRVYHEALCKCGYDAEVYSLDDRDYNKHLKLHIFKKLLLFRKFGFSFPLLKAVRFTKLNNNQTIFHIHGLWMWVNFLPLFVRDLNYIYSPHGSISPSTINSWSIFKNIVFKHIQLKIINKARIVHATSTLEARWLSKVGVDNKLIKVMPLCMNFETSSYEKIYKKFTNKRIFSFVGRIVPIKNLENLIEAFNILALDVKDTQLNIIGNYNTEYGNNIYSSKLSDPIRFLGELSQCEVFEHLKKTDYLVLPSFSENFSYSALESCLFDCNLIVSKQTPWTSLAPGYVSGSFNPYSIHDIYRALHECSIAKERTIAPLELKKFSANEFVKNLNKEISKCLMR